MRSAWTAFTSGFVDLGAGDGCQVPIKQLDKSNSRTMIELRLAPGEGTCLRLEKHRHGSHVP